MNATPVLHYVYDPFCGWCYGAAPMVTAALEVPGLRIEAHGFGMLSGDKARMMSPEWRDFVRPHEVRIKAFSHQLFGEAYEQGVQEQTLVRLDSTPPIAAMLTAEAIDGRGIEMLKRLQVAYYVEGRAIAEQDVLLSMADGLGYDRKVFASRLEETVRADVTAHLHQSGELLNTLGAQGVPTFALQLDDGMHVLPFGHYLSRPHRFKQDLERLIHAAPVAS